MRLLFIINTPGQAHTWKYVIKKLLDRGHSIKIVARDYGSTPVILSACGFTFETFKPIGSRSTRLLGALGHFQICYELSRKFSPSMVVGFGIDAAVTAARLGKPSVVFIDDDHTPFQNGLTRLLGSAIVTPDCFRGHLGRKHIRVNGYKELAYLHPNYFNADPAILEELRVAKAEKYIIVRFNVLDAVHDIGGRTRGFPPSERFRLVKELEKYARVFISPEGALPPQLEPYRLRIPYDRFHHAIYYAQMFVADTGTATVEAALLGTPAVLYHRRSVIIGNFEDLSRRGLMYYYHEIAPAIEKAVELIRIPRLKEEWARRRAQLLAERTDVASFMAGFIEDYPRSLNRLRVSQAISEARTDVSHDGKPAIG